MDSSVLSSKERYNFLKYHVIPEQGEKLLEKQVMKGRNKKVKTLTFQRSWLKEHPWLVYSPSQKGGFCKWCILFLSESKTQNLGVFVKHPFTKLEKATGTNGELQTHASREYHKVAQCQAHAFLTTSRTPQTSIDMQLNTKREEQFNRNCYILECIVDAVVLCGMQNLPLRGHHDDSWTADPTSNKGNFLAILENRSKSDSVLQEHLETGKKNAKYTSKNIQNDVIGIVKDYIQEQLTKEICEERHFFSVIADETTDQYSNKEILSVSLRYLSWHNEKPTTNEVFYDFVSMECTTGKGIAAAILSSLQDLDLNLLRGQAYDGASVMSGGTNGVQALIRQVAPKALYTHCSSHLLNLSIAASCKGQEVRNVIDAINELNRFLDHSPKRQSFFERVLQEHCPLQKSHHLAGMCKTRWVQRHTCLQSYMQLHEYLAIFLDAITHPGDHENIYTKINNEGESEIQNWQWDRETKIKAQGFHTIITSFGHICTFVIMKSCLEPIKPLTAKLQKRDQDVMTAYKNIDGVHEEIQYMRTQIDTIYPEWYGTALHMAEQVGTNESAPRKVSRQQYRSNTPAESTRDYYKRVVAIPVLDTLHVQMEERFSQENRHAMKIFSLLPSVVVKEMPCDTVKSVMDGITTWQDDLPSPDSIQAEVRRWSHFWQTKAKAGLDPPDTFLEAISYADGDFFPNIHSLLSVAVTLPISSCEAERSFSTLRRTKSYLHSTMGEDRLTGLVLMNVHYGLTQKMNRKEIVKRFIKQHKRRMFQSSVLFD